MDIRIKFIGCRSRWACLIATRMIFSAFHADFVIFSLYYGERISYYSKFGGIFE